MKKSIKVISDQLLEVKSLLIESMQKPEHDSFQLEKPRLLYSIHELADFLNCSPTTAQKLKNSGKIPFQQFGRKILKWNRH